MPSTIWHVVLERPMPVLYCNLSCLECDGQFLIFLQKPHKNTSKLSTSKTQIVTFDKYVYNFPQLYLSHHISSKLNTISSKQLYKIYKGNPTPPKKKSRKNFSLFSGFQNGKPNNIIWHNLEYKTMYAAEIVY